VARWLAVNTRPFRSAEWARHSGPDRPHPRSQPSASRTTGPRTRSRALHPRSRSRGHHSPRLVCSMASTAPARAVASARRMANASATVFHRSRPRARNNSADKNTAHYARSWPRGVAGFFIEDRIDISLHQSRKQPRRGKLHAHTYRTNISKASPSTRRNGRSNLEVVSPRLLEPHEAPAGDCALAKVSVRKDARLLTSEGGE